MAMEVKGHSGCRVDVVNEDGKVFVCKSTVDPSYLKRLVLQARKQQRAHSMEYRHIRVPEVYGIKESASSAVVKMQYVYSKNFMEFLEQAGFVQIGYFIEALEGFIDREVGECSIQTVEAEVFRRKFADVSEKIESCPVFAENERILSIVRRSRSVFDSLSDMQLPIGICHGDLTFSNILFSGHDYYLIDFLDSFIETPLQDIAKVRQDTAYRWSQLMYSGRYDEVRLHMICDRMDREIDEYFAGRYKWYGEHYKVMQLMNILRILPYATERRVISYLQDILDSLLDEND